MNFKPCNSTIETLYGVFKGNQLTKEIAMIFLMGFSIHNIISRQSLLILAIISEYQGGLKFDEAGPPP